MTENTFDYYAAKKIIPRNACGATESIILARSSSSSLPVQTHIYTRCGLIYINPRMTKEKYGVYNAFFTAVIEKPSREKQITQANWKKILIPACGSVSHSRAVSNNI